MQGGSNLGRIATNASLARSATAHSVARILREFREIQRNPSPHWCANPLSVARNELESVNDGMTLCHKQRGRLQEEPYEWHFTLRGPPDSHFEGGLYHGRIILPKNYPFAPPNLVLMTQNGRFEVNKKVCLSASSYHPELWQPAWGIRTLLDALCAFFPSPGEGALRALDTPEKIRRQLAVQSVNWTCPVCKKSNRTLMEEACAARIAALPDVPEILHQQALDGQQLVNRAPKLLSAGDSGLLPSSPVPTSSAAAVGSEREAGEISVPQAPTTRGRIHRRRPQRGQRTFLAQLLRIPSTRGELLIATVDVLFAFFLIAFLFVLVDVVLNPPNVKLLPNTKSGWW